MKTKLLCSSCGNTFDRELEEKPKEGENENGPFLFIEGAEGEGFGDEGKIACPCGCVNVQKVK